MIIKTKGIIFRSVKYSETSFITDIYTESKGLQSYIISGVRSKRAKVSAGLLQLMSLVDMVAYYREDKELHRIKEIRAAYIYQSLAFDITKAAVGMFMIELAQKAIREQEENQRLFQFLYERFIYLDQTKHPVANLHLQFMLDLSAYLGFRPHGRYSAITPIFDLQEGVFLHEAPHHLYFIDATMSNLLSQLLHIEAETAHEIKLEREQRKQLLLSLIDYYRLHIEHFQPMNAHLILEEVLGD